MGRPTGPSDASATFAAFSTAGCCPRTTANVRGSGPGGLRPGTLRPGSTGTWPRCPANSASCLQPWCPWSSRLLLPAPLLTRFRRLPGEAQVLNERPQARQPVRQVAPRVLEDLPVQDDIQVERRHVVLELFRRPWRERNGLAPGGRSRFTQRSRSTGLFGRAFGNDQPGPRGSQNLSNRSGSPPSREPRIAYGSGDLETPRVQVLALRRRADRISEIHRRASVPGGPPADPARATPRSG